MPFCNNCGNSVPEGAKFCQVCGAPMASATGALPSARPAGLAPPSSPASSSPPVVPGYPPVRPPPDLPFGLQSDEVIYREIIPHPRLLWRIVLSGILSALFLIVFLILPLSITFLTGGTAFLGLVVFFAVIVVLIIVVSFVYGFLAYQKFRYWITNHRTVGRRGVIGFTIDSIPLETISDVVVQRSVADRILGLASVYVQPFGGQPIGGYGGGGYRFGAISGTNSFLGLTPQEAPLLQQMIFHLRDVRRRETGRLI